MKVYFIRHGQTDWNKDRKLNGLTDLELNEAGIEEALSTGRYLKDSTICTKIISSPLIRAVNTGKYIGDFFNLNVETDKRLIERDYKEWEGGNIDEIDFAKIEDQLEPYLKVSYRVNMFLRDLIKKSNDNDVIFVITHGTILRHIFTIITKQKYIQENFHNLCINSTEYNYETNEWKVMKFNSDEHLKK